MPVMLDRNDQGQARFDALFEHLSPTMTSLVACAPHTRDRVPGTRHLPVPHAAGVYLFTEAGQHRYIGRAKDLNKRFGQHVAPKSRCNQAAFAFNIARRDAAEFGFPVARVKREDLGADVEFNERFFTPAKKRVRAMEFRFVLFDAARPDVDALSTIFEVYASMRLGTEGDFNLFATH